MTLDRGTLLYQRYRIVEILGQGGMGSVYRAIDENLGVEVAIKDNLFTTDEYARQFRLEAVILANLRHANLPRVTDHFVIENQGQYLAMDFIEGEDLRQRMERQGKISEEEAILIGVAMCDALEYLHTRKPPILHRDVKPGNVKISPDGRIFLVDFGLAKMVKGSQATTTGARAMTPGYSPPEQYGTARTDHRTDIYSLGATLYAALTGVIPEDGLARAMDNIALTPLRKRNAKLSRRLASVIEKAMAVKVESRYQTAAEFKKALVAASEKSQQLNGEIVITPPPLDEAGGIKDPNEGEGSSPSDPFPKPASHSQKKKMRTGFWVFLSFLLLTLLLGTTGILVFMTPLTEFVGSLIATSTSLATSTEMSTPTSQTDGTGNAASLTLIPIETAVPTMTIAPTLTATVEYVVITTPSSRYGREIAFSSTRVNWVPQIFLLNLDTQVTRQITNIPEGACQPDWSPDGSRLVFTSPCNGKRETFPDSNLFITDLDGTELFEVPLGEGSNFDPAWSPDGSSIAFASTRNGTTQIYTVDLSNYAESQLTDTPFDVINRMPAWSPTGMQIVYAVRALDIYQLWYMTDSGANPIKLVVGGAGDWDIWPTWSPDGEVILFTRTARVLSWGSLAYIRYDDRESRQARYFARGAYAIDADYSNDGQWLVFEGSNSDNFDIYLMAADGSGRERITTDLAHDFDPAWRPDAYP